MPLTGEETHNTLRETTETQTPVRLAVFDFDGTSIEGNSPVMLVRYLLKHDMLKKRDAFRILMWGAAYKLRLPQNESWVRGLVFSAFEGKPVAEVNQFLADFYDNHIAKRFRAQADDAMRKHQAAGDVVMVVSASFEPIILRAMEHHPFTMQVSTRMKIAPDGTYTRQVDGKPIEGAQKLVAVQEFADETFGPDAWELVAAYGDHHSDRTILSAAKQAYAVDPDRPLTRTARRLGWPVLDW